MKVKVCPVVLRNMLSTTEVLLFKHPLAGIQLVKGTLEVTDHSIEFAATRELAEESGIQTVTTVEYWGEWESNFNDQQWHFLQCHCSDLPSSWEFYCNDDGGHLFEFFWHPLGTSAPSNCHDVFVRAIKYIESKVMKS